MQKTFSSILLILLSAVFLGATIVNNTYLQNIYIDLTQEKIYSLSVGSEKIAARVKEPITLYLFFSEQTSKGMTKVRDYRARVESLLKEYQRLSKGKIKLKFIDPEPYSEAEDRAVAFGLTAAATGIGQDTIYFGLAGTNSVDDAVIISFFEPLKEAFVEFEISRLIYQLNDPEPVHLTIISDLQVAGGENPINGQVLPEFVLYQHLKNIFEVTLISSSQDAIPDNTEVLLLWHPQNLNDSLLLSVDQFLMNGGKTLALLDAHYESALKNGITSPNANSSSLALLASYGINFDSSHVVLDALTGLEVRNPQGGTTRHLGYLGLTRAQINTDDITTGELDSINGASFGTVSIGTSGTLSQTTLLTTSLNSSLVPTSTYKAISDPALLANEYSPQNKKLSLAARFTGTAPSHFAGKEIKSPMFFLKKTNSLNLVVIADADVAADRFWVQQGKFLGQTVLTPFADNGDFIINTLENLSGSKHLIGVRSRGTFARPFSKVQEMQAIAEEKFRVQERRLQAQLEDTEAQLLQLQMQGDSVAFSADREAAIKTFTKQRMNVRRSLRDVQFQLQKDIDELGNTLMLINIVAAPLILVVLLFMMSELFRKRAPRPVPDPQEPES